MFCFPSRFCFASAIPFVLMHALASSAVGQSGDRQELQQLKQMVLELEARVSALEQQNASLRSLPGRVQGGTDAGGPEAAAKLLNAVAILRRDAPSRKAPAEAMSQQFMPVSEPAAGPSALPSPLPGGATINFMLDGYYEDNTNRPIGRVNDLRAYDVLSNAFSINQADVIAELPADPAAWHRRYGLRLDLQFGQATETLQGNPSNEPRPEIYRNIFQAYGTYVFPVRKGLTIDAGKWASSLGVEGNYTKDQMNYSRSYYFYFLPFYHSGVRVQEQLTDKIGINYWVVNGTNQSEPTNSYKDELFGFVLQPAKSLTWTFNYYVGQDHPDVLTASNCSIPVQPGLCLAPISPAPDGKLHIFDSYATWQATSRLTFQAEADYFIEREWANAASGESSAPSHVDGGAGYLQFKINNRSDLALRGEYFSDRGGLFSGVTQALKEGTATYKYKVAENFDSFLEFRRDWSNVNYFTTNHAGALSTQQPTLAVGLVWWYGAKQGSW